MSLRYLLDTNIVSEALRPAPNPVVLQNLRHNAQHLAIPAVVWHELWFGCLRLPLSQRRTVIEAYLNDVVAATMPILPYDSACAAWHAAERARLGRSGLTPSFSDGQIAAVAAVNRLTLVTFNSADFANFANLHIEAWHG